MSIAMHCRLFDYHRISTTIAYFYKTMPNDLFSLFSASTVPFGTDITVLYETEVFHCSLNLPNAQIVSNHVCVAVFVCELSPPPSPAAGHRHQ